MAKLTDTQLVILSAAAGRKDHAVLPLPKSLKIKGAAVSKTLESLRKKGLLDEQPASRDAVAWREVEDGRRMMLVITEAGLRTIDGESASKTDKQSTPPKTRAKTPRAKQKTTAATKPQPKTSAPTARQGTKQALLIDLLKRKTGASIEEIVTATGWQAHSVRGAISGTLKKKLGLAVDSKADETRGRVYRIVAGG